jgi:hypothetical protein
LDPVYTRFNVYSKATHTSLSWIYIKTCKDRIQDGRCLGIFSESCIDWIQGVSCLRIYIKSCIDRNVFSPNFNFLRVLRFPLPIKLTVTI